MAVMVGRKDPPPRKAALAMASPVPGRASDREGWITILPRIRCVSALLNQTASTTPGSGVGAQRAAAVSRKE